MATDNQGPRSTSAATRPAEEATARLDPRTGTWVSPQPESGMPQGPVEDPPWYADHANLALVATWMAAEGYEAHEVAYMVLKPWKFEDEFRRAQGFTGPER